MLLLGALVYGMYPRAKSAWRLHDRATAMADYARCMAGPTGPALFREAPRRFQALVRRRLITARPDSHPFSRCSELARTATGSQDIERAHLLEAKAYAEYGISGQLSSASLAALAFTPEALSGVAERAWPFHRGSYIKLITPSTHTNKEAAHPVPIALPAHGSGIPGWRALYRAAWQTDGRWLMAFGQSANLGVLESPDGGIHWHQVSLNQPGIAEHAGRCVAEPTQTTGSKRRPAGEAFTVLAGKSGLVLNSVMADAVTHQVELKGVTQILSLSCDNRTAVLAVEDEDKRRSLLQCTHNAGCSILPAPERWLSAHFDVAHLRGASVVAVVEGGIVRVRSTRDGGASWTPATVAFDWASQPLVTDVKVPSRLVSLGSRLMLYGAASRGQSYPVVVSDDLGASWHTPAAPSVAPLPGTAAR